VTPFDKYQNALKNLREMDPRTRKHHLIEEGCLQASARSSFLHFNAFTWQESDKYVTGRHTVEVAAALDKAVNNFKQGKSTYLVVTLPFRHGKSQLISRAFPPYVLGRLQEEEPEIILGTYGQDLSNDMSRDAQNIIRSPEYKELYPSVNIDPRKGGVEEWRVENSRAKLKATGLGGGFIGKGAHVLIVDDYLSGREHAESEKRRNTAWAGYTDLITRLAPVHIVIILATRWHVDDVIGRIKNKNDKRHEDYEPAYPKYEIMHYRAREEDGTYLFPERYSKSWYGVQFGSLTPYRVAAELQGEPEIPGGKRIKTGSVHFNAVMPDDLLYVRSWDLASSDAEREGDDPDYTFGICVAVRVKRAMDLQGKTIRDSTGDPVEFYDIYIEDGKFCRAEAPRRDKMIRSAALEDGPEVWQGIESVAGYKDKYTTLKAILKGIRIVRKITLKGDKAARAAVLEPPFEAGNVYVDGNMSDPWVNLLFKHLNQFPSGTHDDGVDALVNAFELALTRWEEGGALAPDNYARNAV